jgi:hypothetical protein
MRRTALVVCLLFGVLFVPFGSAFGTDTPASLLPVASLGELLVYPAAIPSSERPTAFYVATLPDADAVVVLRPIEESEYGSFQVQAVGYQIVEQEMLAAAIVLPFVTPADIAAFPTALADFLKARVNEISGYAVFDVGTP